MNHNYLPTSRSYTISHTSFDVTIDPISSLRPVLCTFRQVPLSIQAPKPLPFLSIQSEESKLPISTKQKRSRQDGTASSVKLFSDGASKNNPGEAGIGFVLTSSEDEILLTGRKYIGTSTNNFAEYTALLLGLETCIRQRYEYIDAYLDSELIVRQIKGIYQIKSIDLKPLKKRIDELISQLKGFSITHIPRSQNAIADKLANSAVKNRIRELDVKFDRNLINVIS